MCKLHLVMPMGGAGSRFYKNGYMVPKPLIEIHGKPFLYWATQSITKFIDVIDLTFVVLQEHIDNFQIDSIIYKYFPETKIIVIPEVLNGPVLTCLKGVEQITDNNPVMFNDCDHLFCCSSFNQAIMEKKMDFDGALLSFTSTQPQYGYIQYDESEHRIIGTVEKKAVSTHAICGAYTFKNAQLYRAVCNEYLKVCEYGEYFVSGVYNVMCNNGMKVYDFLCDFHLPFGTPEEYELAKDSKYFEKLL